MSDREHSFPPEGAALRDVRAKIREMAGALGAQPAVCDNLALVVDELVNNAIEHGAAYRKEGVDLSVSLEGEGDALTIHFFDPEMPADEVQGLVEALAETANGMPSLENERGRGLFLLSVYLEELVADAAPQGGLRLSGRIQAP